MRVAVGVHMRLALDPQARRFGLQQPDCLRSIDHQHIGRRKNAGKPGLMIEPNPDQYRCAAQPRHLARLELDGMRVLLGRGKAFGFHAIAAHCLDQRLEIGGRRYDPRFLLREHRWGRRRGKRGERYEEGADQDRWRFVKMDFGIMQCTPLRTSTTWETRQSPAIETRP